MGIRDTWFLGAGASMRSGAPLTKQFIPWLYEEGQKETRLSQLCLFISDLFGSNLKLSPPLYPKFEQILSFVDAAISDGQFFSAKYDSKKLLELRSDINYLIWRMLEKSLPSLNSPTFTQFVKMAGPDSLFLTVNYDVLLDQCILSEYKNINYGMRFSRMYYQTQAIENTHTPLLLKLHGSVNWLYCPTCESLYCYADEPSIRRIFDPEPVICAYDQTYLRGVLISPTWQKDYKLAPINLMWIKASKLLRDTERITFIGYSLSDIDMKILYMLKRSTFNNVKQPRIRVIDPEPTGKIAKRYQRIFGDIEYHCLSFEEFVS